MYTKQAKVMNKSGLHARPAAELILEAKKYTSSITLKRAGEKFAPVNAKSISRLLAEGIMQGETIEISAEGADERQAVDSLVALVESGLGEG